jgi:hypothetical protein
VDRGGAPRPQRRPFAAVEAHALGGLVVLLRAAGLEVAAAREGPQVIVRFEDDWG